MNNSISQKLKATGTVSTNYESPEDVDVLCDRCVSYAEKWKPQAEKLYRK